MRTPTTLFQPITQVPAIPEAALKSAVEAALRSSNTIVSDGGVLGACLILSLLGNVALVWLLVKVQNLRVQDQLSVAKVAQDMVITFGTVDHALKDLNETSKTQNSVLQGVANSLGTLMMGILARGGITFNTQSPPPNGTPGLPPGGTP